RMGRVDAVRVGRWPDGGRAQISEGSINCETEGLGTAGGIRIVLRLDGRWKPLDQRFDRTNRRSYLGQIPIDGDGQARSRDAKNSHGRGAIPHEFRSISKIRSRMILNDRLEAKWSAPGPI